MKRTVLLAFPSCQYSDAVPVTGYCLNQSTLTDTNVLIRIFGERNLICSCSEDRNLISQNFKPISKFKHSRSFKIFLHRSKWETAQWKRLLRVDNC